MPAHDTAPNAEGTPATPVVLAPTPHQLRIGQLVCCGYANKEIARALGIGESSVNNQLFSLFRKMGVCTRTELVALLMVRRLVDYEEIRRVLDERTAQVLRAGC